MYSIKNAHEIIAQEGRGWLIRGFCLWSAQSGGGSFRRRRFGAGQLGAVPFRRRTFGRRFLFIFYFSSYEEKTMKQAIS